MSWSGISDNQTISFNNLQDAVNNGVFTLKNSIPVSTKCVTKFDINYYVNITSSKPSYASKASNQLVCKSDFSGASLYIIDGPYPVTGPNTSTFGTIINNNSFNIFIILVFNSGNAINMGGPDAVSTDIMYIPSNSIQVVGQSVDEYYQDRTSQFQPPLYSGVLQIPANSNTSFTIDKFDGFGGDSSVRMMYSTSTLGTYINF